MASEALLREQRQAEKVVRMKALANSCRFIGLKILSGDIKPGKGSCVSIPPDSEPKPCCAFGHAVVNTGFIKTKRADIAPDGWYATTNPEGVDLLLGGITEDLPPLLESALDLLAQINDSEYSASDVGDIQRRDNLNSALNHVATVIEFLYP